MGFARLGVVQHEHTKRDEGGQHHCVYAKRRLQQATQAQQRREKSL